jgi:signal transduction histidine kinase
MLFIEALAESRKQPALQIFASDIDAGALAIGRAGIYPASIEADVFPERLNRFFEPLSREARYRVSKQLRESVVFGEHNLIGDPPFSKLDMICCRNLLIYLKPECQRKVLSLFHFALRPEGYLFLGSAETLGREHHLFQTLSKRWRIYQRVSTERSGELDLPVFERGKPRSLVHANRLSGERGESDLASLAYQKLLDWYAPAAVLINRRWEIQYVVGNVEPYLRHAAGVPTNDLLQKLRRGLRARVRSSVEHAIAGQQPVVTAARALNGSKSRDVRISAHPILNDASAELVLVLFEELNPRLRESGTGTRRVEEAGSDKETSDNPDSDDQRTISNLEDELVGARIDLKSALDRGDSSDERFRLSNEEVISANEELQSANEELETSKEELQSLNEELNTVNNQLAAKVDELETKHSDLTNLLAATDVATVCLDADLNIRWFSPATTRIIRLKESDIGRSLADFKHDFVDDSFQNVVGQVLEQKVPLLDEVSCHDGRTYLRRVSRYSTDSDRLAGVVLTFVDITERKEADQSLRDSEEKYRSLSESLDQQVRDRTAVMAILRDITEAANEAISVEAALQIALDRILEYNSWVVGHAWVVTEDSQELASTRVWSTSPQFETSDLVAFRTTTEAIRIPVGGGFVGHVARTAEPHWLESTEAFQHWLRENPVRFGLESAVAFPICIDGNVVAVLEFYSDRQIAREERFTEIMPSVGIQLGHVFERKRLEREVALVADREQRRIGQEMHDGLSQQISGIAMLAGALADNLAAESSTQTERAQRLVAATEEAKQLARGLIKGLLPVEIHPDGLRSGLEELAEQVTSIHGIQCSFESSLEAPAVDSFTATQLYRIAKEAVHNAVKHAKAKSIWVRLGTNQNELLSVEDDGIGLNDDKFLEGEGLRIMRHRAGLFGSTIQIYNKPAGGTVVSCQSRT